MSLEGYRRINDNRGINDCHELLGWIFIDEGKNNDAVNKFETALKWRRKENRPQGMASCMIGLAIAYLRQGKVLKFMQMVFAGLESYHRADILNWNRIFRMLNFIVIFRHLLRKSK
jgi:tetratricopeptide (TPR) repeat protein